MLMIRLVLLAIGLFFAMNIQASPNADALGRCLLDNTSGKDRKDLARWIYVAMSVHPELGSVAKARPQDIESAQRTMGALFTRLLADQCPAQVKAVAETEGGEGMKIAFEYLGKMAMQELMSNQDVSSTLSGFQRYIDKVKFEKTFKPNANANRK